MTLRPAILVAALATLAIPRVGAAQDVRRASSLRVGAGKVPDAISLHNILRGVVRAVADDAGRQASVVEIDLGDGATLLSRITPDATNRLGRAPGPADPARPGRPSDRCRRATAAAHRTRP